MPNSNIEVPAENEIGTGRVGLDDDFPPDKTDVDRKGPEEPFYSRDSELPASEAEHLASARKGKRGRPPNPIVTMEMAQEAVKTGLLGAKPLPVPSAPQRLFKSDAISPARATKQFYNYWNTLPTWAKNFATAYIYRDHPVLLEPEEGDFKYIDKIDGNQPLQDDMDLLNRYGCGSYKIIFNELGKSEKGNNNRVLCEVMISGLGGADYKSNPPTDRRINDIKNLDVTHPANKSYLGFLRGKGIIPEEIDKQKEAEEMATIQAAQAAAEQQGRTIEKLTDKVLEFADRKSEPMAPAYRPEDITRAVQDGIRAGLEEMRRMNPAPQVPQKDPMELAMQLVAMLNGAKNSNSEEVAELRAQIANQNQMQMQALMDQVKELMTAKTTGPASSSPFGGVADGLEALKKMKDTFEDLGIPMGTAGSAVEEVAGAGAPKWLQTYAPLIQQGLPILGQIVSAVLAPRGNGQGQGQAPIPPPLSPFTPNPYQPAPNPNPNPPASMGALPAPVVPPGFDPQLAALLNSIAQPLYNHLVDMEATGTDFATWFSAGFGDDLYSQVAGFGVSDITLALATYPLTSSLLSEVPAVRVENFLKEFVEPKWDEEKPGPSLVTPPSPPSSPPAA